MRRFENIMATGLLDIALLIGACALLGVIAKFLKQPVIFAYLVAGIIIGHFGLFDFRSSGAFGILSEMGIMFLLFLVGMEINYSSLRLVGRTSVIIGISQLVFTAAIGWILAYWLGFNYLSSLYIALALTFSSTIIIVKLLSDKNDLNSLYGKISIGSLLIQDFFAILLLVFLGGLFQAEQQTNWTIALILTLIKGIALFGLMLWLGRKIIPLIFHKIAKSEELLFLCSLAWVFLLAAAVSKIGFSVEIAGFLAGLALANSSERYEISSRIRPLRDFFIVIFFLLLGSSIVFTNLDGLTWPIIIFSLFVLIGNPLVVMIIMGIMGYEKRTGFMTGLSMAQISEFSFILTALGSKLNHLQDSAIALIAAVGVITIGLSSYMIIYAEKIYYPLRKILKIFEKKNARNIIMPDEKFHEAIVLIGCHRVGQSIAATLPKEKLLIVDFDPDIVQKFKKQGYACLVGDISDEEIIEEANLSKAKLIISTSPNFDDNMTLLESLAENNSAAKTIIRAETEEEAELLYKKGVDYVLLPHFTSGQYLGKTISVDPDMNILESLRQRDQALIKKMA